MQRVFSNQANGLPVEPLPGKEAIYGIAVSPGVGHLTLIVDFKE